MKKQQMQRELYDLSHLSYTNGYIGALQTISAIPVVAGDSIEINLNALVRLSPLRQVMLADCRFDLFAFFVPYRHIYGDDWVTFMKTGYDEATTFGTFSLSTEVVDCMGAYLTGTVPKWAIAGYPRIWNRYFRHPTDTAQKADNYFASGGGASTIERLYGSSCCYIPTLWNSGNEDSLDAGDYEVDVNASKVSILDITERSGQLRTEAKRMWFSQRYSDIMHDMFGSKINIDADERPQLLMRTNNWVSGYDVDGTDDASLGSFTGKSSGIAKMYCPYKFYPEHGTIYIMCLPRFPTIHQRENHFLYSETEPNYETIIGDPSIYSRKTPIALDVSKYIPDSTNTDGGQIPFGQFYREHPSRVTSDYYGKPGLPFVTKNFNAGGLKYIDHTDHDEVFQTTQFKQWQTQAIVQVNAKRVIPDPRSSMFAGAGLK